MFFGISCLYGSFYGGSKDTLVSWASLVAHLVKNLPAIWKTWIRFLGWEDPLEKEMATCSSILAWENPMDRGAWWAAVHGASKELDMTEQLNIYIYISF